MKNGIIEIKPINSDTNGEDLQRLYDIMVEAYAITEAEIWGENYARMPKDEFDRTVAEGGMIGAWVDSIPVGSINAMLRSEKSYAFGLLSVDATYKGMNLGRLLINAAEEKAMDHGAVFMLLEILRPEHLELPFKNRLRNWYLKMGYEFLETITFMDVEPNKPEKAKKLIRPSVFDRYRKPLSR